MILFDNMYYLLYDYFKRTNSGKWGYRATAIMLAANYMFFSIINFLLILKIGNSFFQPNDLHIFSNVLNKVSWWENKTVLVIIAVLTYFALNIRYSYFKKFEEIHDIKNSMNFRKRRVLDDLTIIYLIIVPFLMYFLADFVNNLNS